MKPRQLSKRESYLLVQVAAAVSVGSFFYYLRHNQLLLYGDAVAHINIARRVFDSRTPGPLQLGTVWLPLPHLLMLPFLVRRWLWQTGIGGSLPSLAAYIFGVVGIFRMVLNIPKLDSNSAEVRFAAWFAAAVFALNPNLIYLQATAMTEALYLAFFIWAVAFFFTALRKYEDDDTENGNPCLLRAGWCLLAASLTRYDGWFLALTIIAIVFGLTGFGGFRALRPGAKRLFLLAAIGPALWLAYNAAVYRNPLEFANGPYSARAIEQRATMPGTTGHPGAGDLPTSFHYFLKAAELNLAPGILSVLWVATSLLGTVVVLLFQSKLWPLLLLWTPVPFYMLSIAHGGVPIFVPEWRPFSYYNVRYGIELLPAVAVFTAVAVYGLIRFFAETRIKHAISAVFVALAIASYVHVFRQGPVSLQEALVNSRGRVALENEIASFLLRLPPDATYLMFLGGHVGSFQGAGIPLAHVINEGNHRPWLRPEDPNGLWERALKNPARYADYVIAFDSDPVAAKANQRELASVAIIQVTGQPQAEIYQTIKSNQQR